MQPMADSQVNAFLNKLWKMVNDPSTNHLISWAPSGNSFIIQNQAQFWYDLLPVYYKHNNMSSFVRQLNMYGFHKMSTIENGAMDYDKDEIQFFHQYFQKNKPELMKYIKRKVTGSAKTNQTVSLTNNTKPSTMSPEKVSKLLTDMQQLKGRQNTVDTQLTTMKQENAILWRELALLRQQHIKQRQLVNKLIHFLVTIVQPTGRMTGLGVKRRYPLMLNENIKKQKTSKSSSTTSEGPIIHELDTEIVHEDLTTNADLKQEVQATEPSEPIGVDRLFESPDLISCEMDDLISDTELPDDIEANVNWDDAGGSSNNLKVFLNPTTQDTLLSNLMNGSNTFKDLTAETESEMAVAKRDPNQTLKRLHSVEDLDIHVESTQNELDQLKSLLNGYSSLDANTLLGIKYLQLFNHEDTPAYGLATKGDEKMKLEDPLMSGSELTTYSTPLDFSQLFNDDSLEETIQEPLPMSNIDAKGSITTPQVIADEPLFPVGAPSSATKNKK